MVVLKLDFVFSDKLIGGQALSPVRLASFYLERNPFPPEKILAFNQENIDQVPEAEGVYQLYDDEKNVLDSAWPKTQFRHDWGLIRAILPNHNSTINVGSFKFRGFRSGTSASS